MLTNIIGRESELRDAEAEWLRRLTADWQIVADLAFADLVLWVPRQDGGFVAGALCRPGTGSTIYYDDVVGAIASPVQRADFGEVMARGVIQRQHEPRWYGAYGVREEIIPVGFDGRTIAVVTRHANLGATRNPSRLEINYVEIADELIGMMARGEFPSPSSPSGSARHVPRVGDGIVRLNTSGQVVYASPNAISVFHHMGVLSDLTGALLVEVITERLRNSSHVDEALPVVAMGRAPWLTEVEADGVTITLRSLPLTTRGVRTGGLVMCRDITDLRRSEMELMTKDATIREIHHRVKNNLQAVGALLRLQARRSGSPEVRSALGEAVRRVSTIATVHDTLSQTLAQTVDFDATFGRNLRLAADAAAAGIRVHTVRQGSFGQVSADDATVLAIVLTELVTNAVEHGLGPKGGGTVWIDAHRDGHHLQVTISDNGVGLGPGGEASMSGLGTQIVRTFVQGELSGTIEWRSRPGGGTDAIVEASLR